MFYTVSLRGETYSSWRKKIQVNQIRKNSILNYQVSEFFRISKIYDRLVKV